MTPFNVFVDVINLDDASVKNTLSSISSMYHSFTSKHQRKISFIFDIQSERVKMLNDTAKNLEIDHAVSVSNFDAMYAQGKSISIFVDFGDTVATTKIISMLEIGVPFLGQSNSERKEILDNTCSILANTKSNFDLFPSIISFMRMLYYDPEVRKILKRGALIKSKNIKILAK
jgi:uncharacterized protein YjgD (DUF1641 family)